MRKEIRETKNEYGGLDSNSDYPKTKGAIGLLQRKIALLERKLRKKGPISTNESEHIATEALTDTGRTDVQKAIATI